MNAGPSVDSSASWTNSRPRWQSNINRSTSIKGEASQKVIKRKGVIIAPFLIWKYSILRFHLVDGYQRYFLLYPYSIPATPFQAEHILVMQLRHHYPGFLLQ